MIWDSSISSSGDLEKTLAKGNTADNRILLNYNPDPSTEIGIMQINLTSRTLSLGQGIAGFLVAPNCNEDSNPYSVVNSFFADTPSGLNNDGSNGVASAFALRGSSLFGVPYNYYTYALLGIDTPINLGGLVNDLFDGADFNIIATNGSSDPDAIPGDVNIILRDNLTRMSRLNFRKEGTVFGYLDETDGLIMNNSIKSADYKSADGTSGQTSVVTIGVVNLAFKNGLFVGLV